MLTELHQERRNRRKSTRTARKKFGRPDIHRDPSSDKPPPGTGRLKCGIWEYNAGSVELCDCASDRVCFILRGTLRRTDRRKHCEVFGAGECLVIPRAFDGVWSRSGDFAMTCVLVDASLQVGD